MPDTNINNTAELPPTDGMPSDEATYTDATDLGFDDKVNLVDENGVSHEFQILEIFDVEFAGVTAEYAVLDDLSDPAEDSPVCIMRCQVDADDNLVGFEQIVDEAEFLAVVNFIEQDQADDETAKATDEVSPTPETSLEVAA